MAEKRNQLHQLLAVESDLKNKAKIITDEAINTFTKKQEHFDGIIKNYIPIIEDTTQIPPEIKEIVTTVADKIDYVKEDISNAINATLSKEETNNSGEAISNLVIGDKEFTLSATSLLALTTFLEKIRDLYKAMPTLDPTKKWSKDDKAGRSRYKTEAEIKWRTEKTAEPITLAPATDKHPAQVQLVQKDKQVGKYETVYCSGKITPAQKAELISRVEKLIISVKKARAEANQVNVKQVKLGDKIFEYLNKGIL